MTRSISVLVLVLLIREAPSPTCKNVSPAQGTLLHS
jgi:hypothetical protein